MADPYQADFTPLPVVRQGLRYLRDALDLNPRVVFDPFAGPGAFGAVARETWPDVRTWGVEIRGEEIPNLRRNYDWHYVGDWRAGIAEIGKRADVTDVVDLVTTNPAFKHLHACVEPLLEISPVVALFGKVDVGLRGIKEGLFGKACPPPLLHLRVPGAISFRPDGKTDSRCYGWWLWTREGTATGLNEQLLALRALAHQAGELVPLVGPTLTFNLPPLPWKERHWRGQEDPGSPEVANKEEEAAE